MRLNSWGSQLERNLKAHDRLLFLQETKPGRLDVYRKSGLASHLEPHFLFSLTDSWQPTGRPVEWGIEVVLSRIKAHDLWRDDSFMERYIAEHEKAEASKERERKNHTEAFLYDLASRFKKHTGDINTASMKKLYRKEGYSNGYCQPR